MKDTSDLILRLCEELLNIDHIGRMRINARWSLCVAVAATLVVMGSLGWLLQGDEPDWAVALPVLIGAALVSAYGIREWWSGPHRHEVRLMHNTDARDFCKNNIRFWHEHVIDDRYKIEKVHVFTFVREKDCATFKMFFA